jgi:hypothetical protein
MWVKSIGVFWTWPQDQWLMRCNWTLHRLENNPCCQLWTTTKVYSPNKIDIFYFCNANYIRSQSKNLYIFSLDFVDDDNWCHVKIITKFLCTIIELRTFYIYIHKILLIEPYKNAMVHLCIPPKNHMFSRNDI